MMHAIFACSLFELIDKCSFHLYKRDWIDNREPTNIASSDNTIDTPSLTYLFLILDDLLWIVPVTTTILRSRDTFHDTSTPQHGPPCECNNSVGGMWTSSSRRLVSVAQGRA